MSFSSTLPALDHLPPSNEFVTDFTDRLTVEWIDAQFDALMAAIDSAGQSAQAWIDVVLQHSEVHSHIWTHASRSSIAFMLATDDDEATAEHQRFNRELSPAVKRRDIEVTRALLASPAVDALADRFGPVYMGGLQAELIVNDPVNIDLRAQVSDHTMETARIFGAATITWRGQTHPWAFTAKAALDPDAAERHAAHKSKVATLSEDEPALQDAFDQMLALRLKMAENLGLDSYAELRYMEMGRTDWTPRDAASFRNAVEQHIAPVVEELHSKQARQHGVALVHPADLKIWPEETAAELAVSIDEQLDAAARAFDKMGPEFGNTFRMMVNEGLIDLPARSGKTSGAFCSGFADNRVPFIFCNSVGTPDDIATLAHEFGHAMQGFRSRDIQPIFLRQPTLEACEIHSMTLELLVLPHVAGLFGGEEGRAEYAREQVRDSILTVPYMASVDAFQHAIYDPAVPGGLDQAARAEKWVELTNTFRKGIDWSADEWWHRSLWLAQRHIYKAPFYYLDYALAQVVSWELWLNSLEDMESARATYLALCDAGGTKPFRTLVRDAGLGDPFNPQVVARTISRLRPHLGLNS